MICGTSLKIGSKFAHSFRGLLAQPSRRTIMTTALLRKRECAEDASPRCGSENLKKSPCMQKKKKEGEKKKNPFQSIWDNPECCRSPCPDILPRFDELYYKISDKAKRKYTQTWNECPEKKIVQKVICEHKKIIMPKMEKRSRKERPKTASSPQAVGDAGLMKCLTKSSAKCAKITLPGCKGARNPPKCIVVPQPSGCKKTCTPYPAFSECQRDPVKPKRPVECFCLEQVFMCDVFKEIKRRSTRKK